MPSQQQVRWSQLRVGLTVLFASIVLAILIFLMGGTSSLFSRKIEVKAYFDSTAGLRNGAPVRLQGVDVGNVSGIRFVSDPKRQIAPVEVTMKLSPPYPEAVRKDSTVTLATAGVLGEVYVDINSQIAKGQAAQTGDELATKETPTFEDVIRSTNSSLANVDVLIKRLDKVVAKVESGEGSIGKILNDPELFNRANALLSQMQRTVDLATSNKGSIGRLLNDDQLYRRIDDTTARLEKMVREIDEGKGTAGKFLKDPALYDNANQTLAKANKLMDDVNKGQGTLGKLAADKEFAAKIERIVTSLETISSRLERGEGTAGQLLVDKALYTNVNSTMVETRTLLQAVRENPKKYLTIKLELF